MSIIGAAAVDAEVESSGIRVLFAGSALVGVAGIGPGIEGASVV